MQQLFTLALHHFGYRYACGTANNFSDFFCAHLGAQQLVAFALPVCGGFFVLGFFQAALKLWQLASLAVPLTLTLLIQVAVIGAFAYFIIFRVMGGNYEAAVMAAGTCGFGLGATPNAIANMNAMCERYGSAHTAYFVIPLIGAFVVDFLNASILMVFMNLLK